MDDETFEAFLDCAYQAHLDTGLSEEVAALLVAMEAVIAQVGMEDVSA